MVVVRQVVVVQSSALLDGPPREGKLLPFLLPRMPSCIRWAFTFSPMPIPYAT